MTIKEIKKFMKEQHITYKILSKKSNIPLTTLKYIFSGATANPRIDTMTAITNALNMEQPTIINYRLGFKNQIVIFNKSGDKTVFDFKEEQLNHIIKVCEALTAEEK